MSDREDSQNELRSLLIPGTTVRTILRSVSRSGMTRHISLVIADPDPTIGIRDITWLAAEAMGERIHEVHGHWTLKVGGTGMDMGYHLVYSLSRTLYPEGNPNTDADDPGFKDGGYALSQRWL